MLRGASAHTAHTAANQSGGRTILPKQTYSLSFITHVVNIACWIYRSHPSLPNRLH